ncbi:hypothetical protein SEVIR_2G160033v4 [Setaria viridis]
MFGSTSSMLVITILPSFLSSYLLFYPPLLSSSQRIRLQHAGERRLLQGGRASDDPSAVSGPRCPPAWERRGGPHEEAASSGPDPSPRGSSGPTVAEAPRLPAVEEAMRAVEAQ